MLAIFARPHMQKHGEGGNMLEITERSKGEGQSAVSKINK